MESMRSHWRSTVAMKPYMHWDGFSCFAFACSVCNGCCIAFCTLASIFANFATAEDQICHSFWLQSGVTVAMWQLQLRCHTLTCCCLHLCFAPCALRSILFCMALVCKPLLAVLPLHRLLGWHYQQCCASAAFCAKNQNYFAVSLRQKSRCKQHRWIWRPRQRCQQHKPVQCMRIATGNLPYTMVHQGVDVDLNALRGGAGAASAATKRKNTERDLLEGLKSFLQNFHDDDEPQMISQPSQPMPSQPQTHWVHCNNLLLMLKVIQRIFVGVWNNLCQTHAKENLPVNIPAAWHRLLTVIRLIDNSRPTYQDMKLTARGLKWLPLQGQKCSRNPRGIQVSQKMPSPNRTKRPPNFGLIQMTRVVWLLFMPYDRCWKKVKLQLPSFVLPTFRQPPNWEHWPKLMGFEKTSQAAIVVMYGETPS